MEYNHLCITGDMKKKLKLYPNIVVMPKDIESNNKLTNFQILLSNRNTVRKSEL